MNTNERTISPRKKDFIILVICTVAATAILGLGKLFMTAGYDEPPYLKEQYNPYLAIVGGVEAGNPYETFIIWFLLAGLLICLYISFLESRDKDDFVTGKTQTLGVINSFVGIVAIICMASYSWVSFIITDLVICTCTFFVRELGRRFSDKKAQEYVGLNGVLISDLHHHGVAQINGKHLKVWSKEDMKQGDIVEITELKGNYLYVKKL